MRFHSTAPLKQVLLSKRTLILFLLLTFWIWSRHLPVLRPPKTHLPQQIPEAVVLSHREAGINHIFLSGPALQRGLQWGKATSHLLKLQEEALWSRFESFFPNPILRHGFLVLSSFWFLGLDSFIDPDHLNEMYGVSQFAPAEFNFISDPFTRQLAYHGLHEVGQMMVDRDFEARGCTFFGIPHGNDWVVGRNFDFFAGRIFDSEKFLKWVFPETGIPFVSVTWAGMVGVVTGVNAKGVYISLNAAGSSDFRRIGTPSTLVLLKALETSETADQAATLIEQSRVFITDIFSILDASGTHLRVEKTPSRYSREVMRSATVVSNHLQSPFFETDPVNRKRMRTFTTQIRLARGQKLLDNAPRTPAPELIAKLLRDRNDLNDHPYPEGDERAINHGKATHSVIYDSSRDTLYVNRGPSLDGTFLGYDLKESFRLRQPIKKGEIP